MGSSAVCVVELLHPTTTYFDAIVMFELSHEVLIGVITSFSYRFLKRVFDHVLFR